MKIVIITVIAVTTIFILIAGYQHYNYIKLENYRSAIGDLKSGHFASAKEKFLPYAENGHQEARYYLGMIYADGLGTDQNNKIAEEWLACRKDNTYCVLGRNEYRLSVDFQNGQFVTKNENNSEYWRLKAKQKGYPINN